ncbi:DNA/RNA polymerases superfamily protein [Gossypium australe]|uniref:DNA/RNA polymerases superfamily protein n=1 Tax=Gossypium australe TaxID=47621 RepID=A0A5B6W8D8_9ROSI|nr:DNA/RNA polymerases superfamily protein [Gossypium australe]
MDFVSELSLTPTKKDSIRVIVDRLTKSTYFLPVRMDYSLQKLAKLYISNILNKALGARLNFSIVFHPQIEGQSEQVNLRIYAKGLYYRILSFQLSTQMAHYEALYGHNCRTQLCWIELGEREILGLKVRLQIGRSRKQTSKGRTLNIVLETKFKRKGKLSPKFIESYKILKRIDLVTHQLELPLELDRIHDIFHVSMLRRYQFDPSHILPI